MYDVCLGVDLNKVARSSDVMLCNQAAMHKHAVRPRGRRTLPAYQQYLEQRNETAKVCQMCMCQLGHRQFQKSYVSDCTAPDPLFITSSFLCKVFYKYFF